jgi:hypothetical protein
VAGMIKSTEKSKDLIGFRNHDLPACSLVPQTTLQRAHKHKYIELGSGDRVTERLKKRGGQWASTRVFVCLHQHV